MKSLWANFIKVFAVGAEAVVGTAVAGTAAAEVGDAATKVGAVAAESQLSRRERIPLRS